MVSIGFKAQVRLGLGWFGLVKLGLHNPLEGHVDWCQHTHLSSYSNTTQLRVQQQKRQQHAWIKRG